jgi:hypothetical protein
VEEAAKVAVEPLVAKVLLLTVMVLAVLLPLLERDRAARKDVWQCFIGQCPKLMAL